MDTNAQNTLVILFQHVDIYCSMLDHYADRSKTLVGFQISAYENVIQNYLDVHVPQKTEQQRIRAALDLHNLDECGLLSYIDHQRGQFALQRGLLQTIQNLDAKRIRELGQPDLDIIYVQMKKLSDYFIPQGGAYDGFDSDFQENLAALFDVLQETLTKIDHNVRALEGSSKRLSEVLDSHNFNQMVMSNQVRDALQEVIRISKRNIQPTLTFLNEKAMAEDASAMYLIRRIRQSFESTSFHHVHASIATIEMKLLSYAELISSTRRRMHRYVEMDRLQRELYNKIELQFNNLYQEVISRLDTKLTGKRLPANHPLFAPSHRLQGINNWTSSNLTGALIELPQNAKDQYLKEYIRTKLNKADALSTKKKTPSQNTSSAKERYQKSIHIRQIKKSMKTFNLASAHADLYQAVHAHLIETLNDYSLKDIYDALPFIDSTLKRTPTLQRKTIVYQSQKLTYLAKRLELASNEQH